MSHDAELVAKVAEALNEEGLAQGGELHGWRCSHPDRYGPCTCVDETARAVLDALDVPGLIRAAKAESLTEAANSWQVNEWADVLIPAATKNPIDNAQRVVDWLRLRAAEIDPEEGDHEA